MGFLYELLKELPLSAVLKERLVLEEARFARLEKQNELLTEDNARLKAEVETLKAKAPSHSFQEASGVLWKTKANGSFEKVPYCPACERVMSSIEPHYMPYSCSLCNMMAPFVADQIPGILKELEGM